MYCGILILDKPAGLTSHDVVARVRRKLRIKKVGHAGTLDPDATGVLVLCVGDATRLLEYMSAKDKVYTGEVVFGISTETDDASGQVTAECDVSFLSERTVEDAATHLTGRIMQRPPRYSAVHVNGKRAYDLAREGIEFQLEEREVVIHDLSVCEFRAGTQASASFQVHCSKGTYIRSLCRDWGTLLDVPAHMSSLRRIKSGAYTVEEAIPLLEFETCDNPAQYFHPMVEAVRDMQHIFADAKDRASLCHGQTVMMRHDALSPGQVAVLATQDKLVAVADATESSVPGEFAVRPRKVFWKEDDE